MAANTVLAAIGNYTLSSLTLGKGSFSSVKLARHNVLSTNVALKVIVKSKVKDPYLIKNLEREAKILSKLFHPNVVRLYEIAAASGFYCLALEYFPGGNLCEYIQQNGRLSERTACNYFCQIVSGLVYIHEQGIIHRDLKLENLLLDRTKRRVAITDFGLSNFWTPNSNLKTYCGSAEYAAPELFAKARYGPKVDVWSLGIVLYTMLVAELPFQVEEESNASNHLGRLVNIIKRGMEDKHDRKLVRYSTGVRNLLHKMLIVKHEERTELAQIAKDAWTMTGVNPCQQTEISSEEMMALVNAIREKLTLKHYTSQQILQYIRSKKGAFGKTAGCLNILHRKWEQNKFNEAIASKMQEAASSNDQDFTCTQARARVDVFKNIKENRPDLMPVNRVILEETVASENCRPKQQHLGTACNKAKTKTRSCGENSTRRNDIAEDKPRGPADLTAIRSGGQNSKGEHAEMMTGGKRDNDVESSDGRLLKRSKERPDKQFNYRFGRKSGDRRSHSSTVKTMTKSDDVPALYARNEKGCFNAPEIKLDEEIDTPERKTTRMETDGKCAEPLIKTVTTAIASSAENVNFDKENLSCNEKNHQDSKTSTKIKKRSRSEEEISPPDGSFWNTVRGQMAIEALKKIKHSSKELKSPKMKVRKTGTKEEKAIGGDRNKFSCPNNDQENLVPSDAAKWRRSIKPSSQGQPKMTRLKRVDLGLTGKMGKALRARDANIM